MTENGNSNIDGLKRWLIIDTILSPTIILGSFIFFLVISEIPAYLVAAFFIFLLINLGLWLGPILASWAFYKKGMRNKSIIWSIIAFGLSFGFLPLILFP